MPTRIIPLESIGLRLGPVCAVLLLAGALASAAEWPKWLKTQPSGELTIADEIQAALMHYSDQWSPARQDQKTVNFEPSPAPNAAGERHYAGTFAHQAGGAPFQLELILTPQAADTLHYVARVTRAEPVATNELCLALRLPLDSFAGRTLKFDGQPLALPAEYKDMTIRPAGAVSEIILPLATGKLILRGALKVMVQDNRKFNGNDFAMRVDFTPASGAITSAELAFDLVLAGYDAEPISLAPAANMDFKDEQAEDGKGGWTDQGPDNDLRQFKPGRQVLGGVPFDIVDAAQNGGKACVVLAGEMRPNFPRAVEVPVADKEFKYLYLLHAAAWARDEGVYGRLRVEYADGTTGVSEVLGKRDVSDWWAPSPALPLANAAVVWTAENKSSYVGLYLSKFPVEAKPIRKVILESAGARAVWMVAGLSGAREEIPLIKGQSVNYIVAGRDWHSLTASLEVAAGSALDFSFLHDAPAGKHGRVLVQAGKFAFADAPDRPLRFYGTNLCFTANYLEKAECEQLAERLARLGYNSVRFHHHDGGLIDTKAADSLTILPDQLDKLDYLFHCLKEKGIYLTTDLFVSRFLKAAEVSALPENTRYIKGLVPLDPQVMNNLKSFMKLLFGHVNPYTGLALKDDPALFAVSFVNENTLQSVWNDEEYTRAAYEKELTRWAAAEGIKLDTPAERDAALARLLVEKQNAGFAELRRYAREELKWEIPFTDCNMKSYICQALSRDTFDYVDNHGYWDHPKFPVKRWSLPYAFHCQSVLERFCGLPVGQMASRVFGKPFTFTEFNYVFPNPWRAEGGPVMGALCALQDWDAIYRFAFAHRRENAISLQPATGFDTATDPLTQLSERIGVLFFLRGDVTVAPGAVPFVVTPNSYAVAGGSGGRARDFPGDFSRLGLWTKVGSVVAGPGRPVAGAYPWLVSAEELSADLTGGRPVYLADEQLPAALTRDGKVDAAHYDPENKRTTSETGEIRYDGTAKTFTVATPRSECLVLPAGLAGAGEKLAVSANTAFAAYFCGSVDGAPLTESKRLLILHLTDVKNSKTKFLDEKQTILAKPGELPYLVRRGTARLELKLDRPNLPKVWALKANGERVEEVAVEKTAAGFALPLDTTRGEGTLAYEAIWE